MKKLFLPLLLGLFFSQTAYCQLQKGNILMGGAANIYRSHSEIIDVGQTASKNFWNSTTLNPTLGYFITDNWVVGLSFKYTKNNSFNRLTTSNLMTNEYKSETWGSGIFARRYFPLHEKVALFGEFQSTIQREIVNRTLVNNNAQQTTSELYRTFQHQLFAGVSLFPTRWVSIDASVNPFYFGNSKRIDDNDNVSYGERLNSTSVNFGLNSSAVFLGFNFFLNKK